MSRTIKAWAAPLVLVGYTLVTHGFLLLYSGVYSDGWLFYTYFSEGRWDLLYTFFARQGQPQTTYLYLLLAPFPFFLVIHRLLAFAAVLAIALLTYALAHETRLLHPAECLFVALVTVGFPAYQYAVEISHLWNLLPYALFLGGWLLALRSVNQAASRPYFYRLAALLCFVMSFINSALLSFYFGFLTLWYFHACRQQNRGCAAQLGHWLRRRPDFFLLPFLYWAVNRALLPPHGVFADYNQLSVSNLLDLMLWRRFLADGLWGQMGRLAELMPFLLIFLLLFFYLWANRRWRWDERRLFSSRLPVAVLVGYGLWLLFLAILPFAAVAKAPSLYGFDTRVTLLFGLPIALLTLGVVRLLFATRDGRLHRAGGLAIVLLLLGFTLAHMESYLAWQARWVRDQSVLLNLGELPLDADTTLLYVEDRYELYRRNNSLDPASQAISRRYFQDWTIILRQAYGPQPGRVGIDAFHIEPTHQYYHWVLSLRDKTAHEDIFFLAAHEPSGAPMRLIIEPTTTAVSMSKVGLARRYWQYSFLQPSQREPFLRSLTHLRLEPLSVPGQPPSLYPNR